MGPSCSSVCGSTWVPDGPNHWINLPEDLLPVIMDYLNAKELVKLMKCNRTLRLAAGRYIEEGKRSCDNLFETDVIDMNKMDFAWKGDNRYAKIKHRFFSEIALWWFEFNGTFTIPKKGQYYLLFYSPYLDYDVSMSLNDQPVFREDIISTPTQIGTIPMILHSFHSDAGELKVKCFNLESSYKETTVSFMIVFSKEIKRFLIPYIVQRAPSYK